MIKAFIVLLVVLIFSFVMAFLEQKIKNWLDKE